MYISFEYYRIFYYVAKYGSISQAAEALMNNQPNISRTIKNLESELNCTLFVRSRKGVELTPEGEKLYSHVAAAVEQIQYGEEELCLERTLAKGVVTIGASEIALRCYLLPVLKNFRQKYPGVRIRVFNHSTPQAISALKHGLVDLGVVTTHGGHRPHRFKGDMRDTGDTGVRSGVPGACREAGQPVGAYEVSDDIAVQADQDVRDIFRVVPEEWLYALAGYRGSHSGSDTSDGA